MQAASQSVLFKLFLMNDQFYFYIPVLYGLIPGPSAQEIRNTPHKLAFIQTGLCLIPRETSTYVRACDMLRLGLI